MHLPQPSRMELVMREISSSENRLVPACRGEGKSVEVVASWAQIETSLTGGTAISWFLNYILKLEAVSMQQGALSCSELQLWFLCSTFPSHHVIPRAEPLSANSRSLPQNRALGFWRDCETAGPSLQKLFSSADRLSAAMKGTRILESGVGCRCCIA